MLRSGTERDLLLRRAVDVGRALAARRPARPRGAPRGPPPGAHAPGVGRLRLARRRPVDQPRTSSASASCSDVAPRRLGRRGRLLPRRDRRRSAIRRRSSPRPGTSTPSPTPTARSSRASAGCARARPRRCSAPRRSSSTSGAGSPSSTPTCPPTCSPRAGRAGARTTCSASATRSGTAPRRSTSGRWKPPVSARPRATRGLPSPRRPWAARPSAVRVSRRVAATRSRDTDLTMHGGLLRRGRPLSQPTRALRRRPRPCQRLGIPPGGGSRLGSARDGGLVDRDGAVGLRRRSVRLGAGPTVAVATVRRRAGLQRAVDAAAVDGVPRARLRPRVDDATGASATTATSVQIVSGADQPTSTTKVTPWLGSNGCRAA